ncbi:hypothetical protein [Nocardia sp. NPDC057668]|uniref:hypothetical protein n=1 Tax=Nocardia sp. NPDC057668 TaxID=3346202 RepID=UPI00366CC661
MPSASSDKPARRRSLKSRQVTYALPAAVAVSLLVTGCGGSNRPATPKPVVSSSTQKTTTAPRTTTSPGSTTKPGLTKPQAPVTTTERGGLGGSGSGGGGGS